MKKIVPLLIAVWFLYACSSSDPSIMDASSSDYTPVQGQTVLLRLTALSDSYPMRYSWSADSGELVPGRDEETNQEVYFAYWTAPETTGPVQVSCTVTDDNDNATVYFFDLRVIERFVEVLNDGSLVASMEKQAVANIGGIWASFGNGEVRYISSDTNELSTWTGVFGAMYAEYNPYNMTYALWGAQATGKDISEQSSVGTATLTCTPASGTLHDLIASIAEPDYYLLVGSDAGLHAYNSVTDAWTTYTPEKTNSFFKSEDESLIYAATSGGIYSLDPDTLRLDPETPVYAGDSCAVVVDGEGAVWHVTGGQVCKNGVPLDAEDQPERVACSLDIDLKGRLWCGKYYWDGTAWQTPVVLDLFTIDQVVASREGVMYFITASRALLRY